MPKKIIAVIAVCLCFLCSCKKDNGLNTKTNKLAEKEVVATSLDTSVSEPVVGPKGIAVTDYKTHIENPQNGFIKHLSTPQYDLEMMYRPISYEALLGLDTFDKGTYQKSQQEKAGVISFTIKRTSKTASVFKKPNDFSIYLQDDSSSAKLDPVYFMSDHKLGQTEVFYAVFDRASAAKLKGKMLHFVWADNGTSQDLYYTKRILNQNFIKIHHVN